MDSTKSITWGQAFAHCASTGSYWLWIVITLVLIAVTAFLMIRFSKKAEINPYVKIALIAAMVMALFCAFLMRPSSVAANTSVEMAARGHYLGY